MVSFLLLAALIGAVVLSRKEDGPVIRLPFLLFLRRSLFSAGVYGVLARRNAVLVLMSIELMLNAVNVNLVAFSRYLHDLHRADLRAVRHHGRRGRGRDRPGDRDPDLPQPRDDQRRRGEPAQVVAAESTEALGRAIADPNSFLTNAWLIAFLPAMSAFLTLFLGKRTPGKGVGVRDRGRGRVARALARRAVDLRRR